MPFRSESRDQAHGSEGGEWERFQFNRHAELEEEAVAQQARHVPGNGCEDASLARQEGGEEELDVPASHLNAVSFKTSAHAFALSEREAAHEAAIFGGGSATVAAAPSRAHGSMVGSGDSSGRNGRGVREDEGDGLQGERGGRELRHGMDAAEPRPPIESSWRERAAQLKAQRGM
jgi:hypothetical protein